MSSTASGLDPTMAAFAGLGPAELAVIVLVILLLFGGRKLPEMARGTGRALRIFKAETKGLMDDDDDDETTDQKSSGTQQSQQQITQTPVAPPAADPSAPAPSSAADPMPPTHTEK